MALNKKIKKTKPVNKRKSKKNIKNRSLKKRGKGLINKLIDVLPFEAHVPGYQYCGPGTKLEKRLKRGDPGINPLDAACKTHDIAYSEHKDSARRSEADKTLQNIAMKRVFAKDSSLNERAVALGVAAAMKAKRTIGGKGLRKRVTKTKMKKKQVSFATLLKNAKIAIKKNKPPNIDSAINVAVASVKSAKKGKCVKTPRIIKLPSISGGVLPLVPIFAGLSALGSIVGSTAGVVNAINQAKKGQKELEESRRHNGTMEAIALGRKNGNGFYLRPDKTGNGFYLSPYSKNH